MKHRFRPLKLFFNASLNIIIGPDDVRNIDRLLLFPTSSRIYSKAVGGKVVLLPGCCISLGRTLMDFSKYNS